MADETVSAQLHLGMDPEAPPPDPVYSNYVQASFTPEDFSLLFGYYAFPLAPPENSGDTLEVPVQPMARVVLPLNLIHNLLALLERQVAGYEANFGKLPEHPNPPAWMKESEVP